MSFEIETLQRHLPYYLSNQDKKRLADELKAISQGGTADYILSRYQDSFLQTMLQGDGWEGFCLFRYPTGKRVPVKGLVLSNSCDADPGNQRDFPPRIIFAPLSSLSRFESFLRREGVDETRIMQKLDSIRSQRITSIFFLPAGNGLNEDYIVRFDEAYSMPAQVYSNIEKKRKLFTLNQVGFYMLIVKLSIHFCRLHENVDRNFHLEKPET
ncbi:MAG: hypothetical protein OXF73_09590 [Gammaproteobacteria bacterium]|nr:hypothetical protein [Gammaproteobacteria bacterium]